MEQSMDELLLLLPQLIVLIQCSALHRSKRGNRQLKLIFFSLPFFRLSRDDWVPDTGNDDQIQYKLNVCHTVLYKELDVKNPDGVASWGKRGKGRSLG